MWQLRKDSKGHVLGGIVGWKPTKDDEDGKSAWPMEWDTRNRIIEEKIQKSKQNTLEWMHKIWASSRIKWRIQIYASQKMQRSAPNMLALYRRVAVSTESHMIRDMFFFSLFQECSRIFTEAAGMANDIWIERWANVTHVIGVRARAASNLFGSQTQTKV